MNYNKIDQYASGARGAPHFTEKHFLTGENVMDTIEAIPIYTQLNEMPTAKKDFKCRSLSSLRIAEAG